jgi:hypothetical protein
MMPVRAKMARTEGTGAMTAQFGDCVPLRGWLSPLTMPARVMKTRAEGIVATMARFGLSSSMV